MRQYTFKTMVRFTEAQREAIEKLADERGMTFGTLLRVLTLQSLEAQDDSNAGR